MAELTERLARWKIHSRRDRDAPLPAWRRRRRRTAWPTRARRAKSRLCSSNARASWLLSHGGSRCAVAAVAGASQLDRGGRLGLPWQVAPGIETVATGAGQLQVAAFVLKEVAKVSHVRPEIFLDAELDHLPEKDAPGADSYRRQLKHLLGSQPASALPHEKIIACWMKRGNRSRAGFEIDAHAALHFAVYSPGVRLLECGSGAAFAAEKLACRIDEAQQRSVDVRG